MRWTAALASLCLLGAPAAVSAHHSVASQYDRDKAVSIKGKVVRIAIVNPHSHIEIEMPGAGDAKVVWKLESSSAAGMQRMGLGDGVRVGDAVEAIGYPARSGERTAWLTRLETPHRVFDLSYRSTAAPKPVPAH
jgi:hypothetical protein